MKDEISITNPEKKLEGTIVLPGSKSESNRALIINALSKDKAILHNISSSSDTSVLENALRSKKHLIDIQDAGTAMRFLLAYYAVTSQQKELTGTERMCQRPIGPLVDALNTLGFTITYKNKNGFPPVAILSNNFTNNINTLHIPAHISSQFISAILMIAPSLPNGLNLILDGNIASRPYIEQTLEIMHHFGIQYSWINNLISISHQQYISKEYTVESDWSSASYWYAMASLSEDPAIFLTGLKRNSLQGDSICKEWFNAFGIITEFSNTGAYITKGSENISLLPETIDFSNTPDLAQTIIVHCAIKKIQCKFTGIQSLRIKETDRIEALAKELYKVGIRFFETSPGTYSLEGQINKNIIPEFDTYNDHRMAMALSLFAMVFEKITIKNPSCTKKSYPEFWDHLEKSGFYII